MKDLNSVKIALNAVYTLTDQDKININKAENIEELTPYFKRLGTGSTAKFFSKWQ